MSAVATTRSSALAPRVLGSALDALVAWQSGLLTYWADALSRRAKPAQLTREFAKWATLVTDRSQPSWSTPHRVVMDSPLLRVRDFTSAEDAEIDVVPTLVIPPQAGHSSCIVDFSPRQSQIAAIRTAGLRKVWSLDWVGGSPKTKDATIEDYVREVERAVTLAGGRVNLIGDCQGGWLAVIYAALHPDHIHTLTIAGAPVDFHCGEPLIQDWLEFFNRGGRLDTYRKIIDANRGVLPGELMLAGFVVLNPKSEIDRKLDLLSKVHDEEYVERFRQFDTWFRHTQDINGAFYLWIVEHLFVRNELVAGTVRVAGERVDLAAITCPVYLMAGASDHITPPDQVWALSDHIGTREQDVVRRLTTGGHLGLFMGHEALSEHWPPILADIARRSVPPQG